MKKVGKTTIPFRYDLNQIPYDYTVEVTNRFKGLNLIECLITIDDIRQDLEFSKDLLKGLKVLTVLVRDRMGCGFMTRKTQCVPCRDRPSEQLRT